MLFYRWLRKFALFIFCCYNINKFKKQKPFLIYGNNFICMMIRNFFNFTFELIKAVVISLVIIMPIRYFLIQPFIVKGASMEPNFYDEEYLIINEISYRFAEPRRGDIVVFRY
ncbi:MAG: signal peptidase I, partial [Nitrospirota bacterium]|nr:signal peptidase I [Nitrospirota bacterium]